MKIIKQYLTVVLLSFIVIFTSCGDGDENIPILQDGTEAHPYLINSLDELRSIATGFTNDVVGPINLEDSLSAYYSLEANIDASQTDTRDVSPIEFTPIGDEDDPFTGIFNGNSKRISNLYINSDASNVGLFGYVNGGDIFNLTLDTFNITGDDNVGSLIGKATGNTFVEGVTLENCHVYGASLVGVLGGYYTGDLSQISINSSSASGRGDALHIDIGGCVGYMMKAEDVEHASAQNVKILNTEVTGDENIGGFAGEIHSLHLSQIFVDTQLLCHSSFAGGLIGSAFALYVNESASFGEMSGQLKVGGLIGNASGEIEIISSYASNEITVADDYEGESDQVAGGFVGNLMSTSSTLTITDSYARNGWIPSPPGETSKGLLGYKDATEGLGVTSSYWDTTTSGITSTCGDLGEGKSSTQLKEGADDIYSSWGNVWDFGEDTEYPVLASSYFSPNEQRSYF